MTELLFDNLNLLRTDLTEAVDTYGSLKNIPLRDGLGDIILDYLVYAYVMGVEDVNEQFETDFEVQPDRLEEVVNLKIADKDYRQRVEEYVNNGGTVDDIMRIVETDTTRIYNTGGLDTAVKAGAKYKRWNTMQDDRVRDTHDYLLGTRMPIDADFYTYDGDHASGPGGFQLAENNVNCRCWLTFT